MNMIELEYARLTGRSYIMLSVFAELNRRWGAPNLVIGIGAWSSCMKGAFHKSKIGDVDSQLEHEQFSNGI